MGFYCNSIPARPDEFFGHTGLRCKDMSDDYEGKGSRHDTSSLADRSLMRKDALFNSPVAAEMNHALILRSRDKTLVLSLLTPR